MKISSPLALALALSLQVPASASPVVVELFTSQGCSSCPPADELVSTWGMREFQAGRAIPLSFNVDYWNYLGWRDLFSTPAYTRRQRAYAAALRVGVYTPQMVVGGVTAFVGSDAPAAASALARATGGNFTVQLRPAPSGLTVTVLANGEATGSDHVMLALFENGLLTDVRSGENSNQRLRNDFVVRRLVDLGAVPAGGVLHYSLADWDPSWKKENAGAAAFLQNPENLSIDGAGSLFPLR